MKKFVLNNITAWSMIMAVYQIAGGIGMLLVVFFNISIESLTFFTLLYLAPIVGLSLASLVGGISYFTKNNLRFFVLSKINFWAQTVQLSVPILGFTYYYGPYLYIGIGGGGFRAGLELITAYFMVKIGPADNYYLFVNAIPIFFIQVLKWIERNPAPPELENAFMEELKDEVI